MSGSNGLESVVADLWIGRRRLVGWGTGGALRQAFALHPLPLAYLVDNDSSLHGRRVGPFDVCAPEVLFAEDPAGVTVAIFSMAQDEIRKQLAAQGFDSIDGRALGLHPRTAPRRAYFEARLEQAAAGAPTPKRSTHAVVIQGPVLPGLTACLARYYARCGGARVVLSTWNDTPSAQLDELAPWLDSCITSEPPAVAGPQNRNYQIVSARAGLRAAQELGAEFAIKTRTDLAVLQPDAVAACQHEAQRFDEGPARALGLWGRLVVPRSFTRRYLPYHPSDMLMAGHIEDLRRYWDAPLDMRRLQIEQSNHRPMIEAAMSGGYTECYLALAYCQNIGRPVKATLEDSWQLLRDLFVVRDNEWFDLYWAKDPLFDQVEELPACGITETVSSAVWDAWQRGPIAGDPTAAEIDVRRRVFREERPTRLPVATL